MTRKAWICFTMVQIFGEFGPWAGLHMNSALGSAFWVTGIAIMMPGRLLALLVTESKFLWNSGLIPLQMTAVFVLIEVLANLFVWLLCARLFRALRRRRAISSPVSP